MSSPTFKFLKEADRDEILEFILSDSEPNEENQPTLELLESEGFNSIIR